MFLALMFPALLPVCIVTSELEAMLLARVPACSSTLPFDVIFSAVAPSHRLTVSRDLTFSADVPEIEIGPLAVKFPNEPEPVSVISIRPAALTSISTPPHIHSINLLLN